MSKPFIVCIVDDDDIYQFTVTRTIEKQAIAKKILVFSDGQQAIDFLDANLGRNDNLPDVIFLDINMPVMDGWQFLEEYVKIKPKVGKKITIYMVTSSVDPTDVDKAKKISDVSDYIVKPVKPEQLKSVIDALEPSDIEQ